MEALDGTTDKLVRDIDSVPVYNSGFAGKNIMAITAVQVQNMEASG